MPNWMIQAGMWLIIAGVSMYGNADKSWVQTYIAFAVAWTIAGYLKGGEGR